MKQNLVGKILGKIKSFGQDFVTIVTGIMGSEPRSQNFDLATFQEIIPRDVRLRILKIIPSRRPSPNLAQNFGQIPINSRALGSTVFKEKYFIRTSPRGSCAAF